MGKISWECQLCRLSLHHAYADEEDSDAWQMPSVLRAENGIEAEGDYDGFGTIGTFQIPEEWVHDDITFWTSMIREHEADIARRKEFAVSAREVMRILGEDPSRSDYLARSAAYDPAEDERSLARDRQHLEKAQRESVRFTVYHRRCWEANGRPGFTGQSRWAEDQGR